MSENIERFASLMDGQMRKTSSAMMPRTLDLGVIGKDMSLIPDSFRTPIPRGSYMVDLRLTGSPQTSDTEHTHSGGGHAQEGGSGAHSHTGGKHHHDIPSQLRKLRAGDRVLVAWIGNEAVVVAIVVSS